MGRSIYAAGRERNWWRMFPPVVPIEGTDFAALARRPLAGEPVRMRHVARTEYAKLERPFTELENVPWE